MGGNCDVDGLARTNLPFLRDVTTAGLGPFDFVIVHEKPSLV